MPEKYLNKEWTDLRGKQIYGVDACAGFAYDPFRKALIDDFKKGWEELMKYDWASVKSYLVREVGRGEEPNYPLSVIQWMETRDSGTGSFDRAFSEVSIFTLPSGLALDSNRPPDHP